MSSDLQTARYDRLLRRVGGIIGPGSKVTEALSELFPMLDMENMPHELLVLSNTQTVFSTQILQPVAAEFGRAQLFNPEDSNALVIPTSVFIAGAAGGVAWEVTDTQIVPPGNSGQFRDTRSGLALESAGKISGDTDPILIPQRGRLNIDGVVSYHLHDPNGIAVLGPGTGLTFSQVTKNLLLIVTIFWRERQALESELNF